MLYHSSDLFSAVAAKAPRKISAPSKSSAASPKGAGGEYNKAQKISSALMTTG